MSKIQRSTGGFTVDEIKNNIKMYANNYRVTKDKSLLIDIMKTVTPIIGDDISEEIVKSLKKEHKRVFGIKKAMEDDAIVKEFNNRKQQFPKQTNKKICEDLSVIFKRSNSENIRKVLEKAKALPLKK